MPAAASATPPACSRSGSARRALKPGGRFVHIVWRAREDNHWGTVPKEVLLRHVPPPGDDAQTCGPGPISMADEETTRGQMQAAGVTDIEFERVDCPFRTGDDVEDAIAFQLAVGPAGEVYREAGEEAKAKHEAIMADLRAAYAPYAKADGVFMPSSSWVITARKPG